MTPAYLSSCEKKKITGRSTRNGYVILSAAKDLWISHYRNE
jgi:hypothetical protein